MTYTKGKNYTGKEDMETYFTIIMELYGEGKHCELAKPA